MSARTILAPTLLVLLCAAFNLAKPVHMDDTAHLAIARHILADPLHPMSGAFNWYETEKPIHELNQPHLFFYLLAAVMHLFGESEWALHALVAGFSAMAVFFFYLLARAFVPAHALAFTAMFALGPAFLPGQNLMVDVPMTALWLVAFWGMLTATPQSAVVRYTISAVAIAAACLTKYVSIILIPILIVALLTQPRRSLWALVLVPVVTLLAWSAFNVWDYGGVHIFGRPAGGRSLAETLATGVEWLVGLGAVAPFTLMAASRLRQPRIALWAAAGVISGMILFVWMRHRFDVSAPFSMLWAAFMGNGLLALGLAVNGMTVDAKDDGTSHGPRVWRNVLLLALWLAGVLGFMALFAPFLAVRHVLPAIPAVLLLTGMGLEEISSRAVRLAAACTAALGILLAVSDHQWATVYRDYARGAAAHMPKDARVWSVGHWGWQWYSRGAGMLTYDNAHTELEEGDWLITPLTVSMQTIRTHHHDVLKATRSYAPPSGPLSWIRTMGWDPPGGYYGYALDWGCPPWFFSRQPLETFVVFRVHGSGFTVHGLGGER